MQIGMELWAQYAHKALWHNFEPGWALHKSHHVPRIGPFEDNDVFAVINAIPAMGLCAFGFLTPGVYGGACFSFVPLRFACVSNATAAAVMTLQVLILMRNTC